MLTRDAVPGRKVFGWRLHLDLKVVLQWPQVDVRYFITIIVNYCICGESG